MQTLSIVNARLIRAPIGGHRLIRVQSMQGGQSIVRGRMHKRSLSIIREMKVNITVHVQQSAMKAYACTLQFANQTGNS